MRSLLTAAPLLASAAVVSGCMSSPTYGTGKSSSMQLLEDVAGIASLGDKKREAIAYAPRPELVKPGEGAPLVAPQDEMATASNAAWPESPEARRARIKAEATANQDNPNYRAPVVMDTASAAPTVTKPLGRGEPPSPYDGTMSRADQRAEFNRRLAMVNQGDPTQRKFLSEPPGAYRAPEATAPVGDVGEDEWKKERKNKRASRKKGGLRDILPW